ncbi:hypothetical protein H6S82_31070 [Planktothrix sp. FACHB-1355]|uniref:Uncharacterized protein n=1 Tax=Aerosakkonema funiforme FACHB-1375 TaxID=2949571 RepID=A0A926VHG0_9CYAN|nr:MULTISPECIES: hypothetical protein [Oscillatoriales]MBD2183857.1 hypothetical protein [Aerosakkonema funiforme FACHB-1375]MBD3563247.1 hypothetical protein [Planktothrix sp. FACHB-1355]
MDSLRIAKQINSELALIRSQYHNVLSAEERSEILDSITTCLANEFADVIYLSICDRQRNQELLKWSYDLSDRNYPQRVGPETQDVMIYLAKHSYDVYINCTVKWSSRFSAMDKRNRENELRGTIWDENRLSSLTEKVTNLEGGHHKDLDQNSSISTQYLNLQGIEKDLSKLALEEIIDKKDIENITHSLKNDLDRGYIQGVSFSIKAQTKPIIEWEFELDSSNLFNRSGDGIENVDFRQIEADLALHIKPIFSEKFKQMTQENKQQLIKEKQESNNPIWFAKVGRSKKGIFEWFKDIIGI